MNSLPVVKSLAAFLVAGISLVSPLHGENFTSERGLVEIADLGDWTVVNNVVTERENGVLVHLNRADSHSVRIELYDVNYVDVFSQQATDAFREGFRKNGAGIVTVKPVDLGGRRYQGIFCAKLDTSTEKPLVIYIEQLILVDGKRLHNITIASERDEPETNPEIIRLLQNLKIK